jgi:hypothetical protein
MRGTTLLCLLMAALCASASAAERLMLRPWVELEPLVRIDPEEYPIPLEKAEKKLLDEGRILVSGMVYGWSFTYTPGDTARRVSESFLLSPLSEVPWGSARFVVRETETIDKRLFARISYTLSEDEALRRAAWESNTAILSTGMGKAEIVRGPRAKTAALQDAVRDAIRLGLHTRYLNKPREITGEVVLWDDPRTTVRSGAYTTVAKVKLLVREVIPYRIF